MPSDTVTKAEVEVLINSAFERYIPRIAEECKRNDELSKAQCQAHQIFCDNDNVKCFFALQHQVNAHIDAHKKRDVFTRWLLSLLCSGVVYQFVKGFFVVK